MYELFIFALTILSLFVMAGYFLLPDDDPTRSALYHIDILLSLVFLTDSVHLLVRAPDKKAYLRWGWLDFLGSVPSFVALRAFRVARLVRAWRVVRTRNPRQVLREFEGNRAEGTLLTTFFIAIMVLSIGSLLVLHFEGRAPGANIDSGPDAVWWAIVTIATVGYGDLYPVTALGRITAVVLMLVGIGIFGVLASYLASTFVASDRARARDVEQIVDSVSELHDDVADLKSELKAVRELLRARGGDEHPTE